MSLLFRTTSEYHRITVDDDQDGAITLRFGGRRQSTLDSPTGFDAVQPILDYLHVPMAMRPDARRALLIGLGGGVLPKRMWRDYPWLRIDVVELDPAVVDIAHRFFGLPPDNARLAVHLADGRGYVDGSRDVFDIMVVDAYFEDAMPFRFVTNEFFAKAVDRLARDGVLAYNLVSGLEGERSAALRKILAGVQRYFAWAGLFPVGVDCGGGRQNLVLAACKSHLDAGHLLDRIRGRAGGRITVQNFERFGDRLVDGYSLVEGEEPFFDGSSPPDGLLHT